MDNFLRSVAEYLYKNHVNDFKDMILVFPNRRSGVFFNEELKKLVVDTPVWAPNVQTINDFICQFSEYKLADHIQLIAELYQAYKKVSKSNESFDDFFSWGEVLLADFNDVDKYNLSAKSVFVNVKEFKSIENNVDLFDDEQKQVLERFFGAFDFEKKSVLRDAFLKIWEVLYVLYKEFYHALRKKNIAFEGMIYKDALNNIQKKQNSDFAFKKICFVGFNAITPIEEEIFKCFKNNNLAYFFWDYDEFYVENKIMEAGLFQRKYIHDFPPVQLDKSFNQLRNKPVTIISASTNHGQVAEVNYLLQNINKVNHEQTALVLADEGLLLPVLNYISGNIEHVNITMGYPINNSLSGNFIELLMQMQLNKRISDKSDVSFYYRQVVALLQHTFVQIKCADDLKPLLDKIIKGNLYYMSKDELGINGYLSKIFVSVDGFNDCAAYFEQVLEMMLDELLQIDQEDKTIILEREFLFNTYREIMQLNKQISAYQLNMQLPTYFGLIRKVLKLKRVPFEGEPIKGIQIMGFLETRNLDFKNVIITSVNEGVVPVQARATSFIPYNLRRGFGLPTGELSDAMYAYYFYRLLQGAENVWLIYNSSQAVQSTGEKSRLLYQLEFDEGFQTTHKVSAQIVEVVADKKIQIEKKDKVWERLEEYLNAENNKILSPSALSIYLQCKLRFYFKAIAKIKEADEVEEVIDARIFGNIFHKAAELIYSNFKHADVLVTVQEIEKLINKDEKLDKVIGVAFSKVFYGEKTERLFKIEGKNQLVFDVIKKYLVKMLQLDKSAAPFSVVGLETNVKEPVSFKVHGHECKVLVGGQIDRLDRSGGSLRVIDYKTGNDKLSFAHLDDVFNTDKIKDTKAIFQTFVYAFLLTRIYPDENNIKPAVYQVRKMFDPRAGFEISTKKYDPFLSGNFIDIANEVANKLTNLLTEIFNREIPFTQTDNRNICKNCPYKNMCGR